MIYRLGFFSGVLGESLKTGRLEWQTDRVDLENARLGLCNERRTLLAKPELSGSATVKIIFLRNACEELGGTKVGVE